MTKLSSTDKSQYAILSDGGRTVSIDIAHVAYAHARAYPPKVGPGHYVLAVTNAVYHNPDSQLSLAMSNIDYDIDDLDNYPGIDTNSHGLFADDGELWNNDTAMGTCPSFDVNTVFPIFISIRITATDIFWSASGDGTVWDPEISAPVPPDDLYFSCGPFQSPETITVDFAPTGWTLPGAVNYDDPLGSVGIIGGLSGIIGE
jgi:hypothetical protein